MLYTYEGRLSGYPKQQVFNGVLTWGGLVELNLDQTNIFVLSDTGINQSKLRSPNINNSDFAYLDSKSDNLLRAIGKAEGQ